MLKKGFKFGMGICGAYATLVVIAAGVYAVVSRFSSWVENKIDYKINSKEEVDED